MPGDLTGCDDRSPWCASDSISKRDKIRTGTNKYFDFIHVRRETYARHFKNFRPPGNTLDDRIESWPLSGIWLAEHHVISARFSSGHRVMARGQCARAGDTSGLEEWE